jgi:hypothetical protein
MIIELNKILFLVTLALSFFTLGLVLSNLINEIFPACDFKKEDKYMIIECVGQLVLVYGFYFMFNEKISSFIENIFKNMKNEKIDIISKIIILISFSTGVYKHLDELNMKTEYLKNKYFG